MFTLRDILSTNFEVRSSMLLGTCCTLPRKEPNVQVSDTTEAQ